jgi:hypothetical protein
MSCTLGKGSCFLVTLSVDGSRIFSLLSVRQLSFHCGLSFFFHADLVLLRCSAAPAISSSALELLRSVRRITLEKACESSLKQGVLEVATRYIKGSFDVNKAELFLRILFLSHFLPSRCCCLLHPGGESGEVYRSNPAVGGHQQRPRTACELRRPDLPHPLQEHEGVERNDTHTAKWHAVAAARVAGPSQLNSPNPG